MSTEGGSDDLETSAKPVNAVDKTTAWDKDGADGAVLPTPLVILEDIYGEIVVGSALRTVRKGEQGAFVFKRLDGHDGSVPDLHANPVAGL